MSCYFSAGGSVWTVDERTWSGTTECRKPTGEGMYRLWLSPSFCPMPKSCRVSCFIGAMPYWCHILPFVPFKAYPYLFNSCLLSALSKVVHVNADWLHPSQPQYNNDFEFGRQVNMLYDYGDLWHLPDCRRHYSEGFTEACSSGEALNHGTFMHDWTCRSDDYNNEKPCCSMDSMCNRCGQLGVNSVPAMIWYDMSLFSKVTMRVPV